MTAGAASFRRVLGSALGMNGRGFQYECLLLTTRDKLQAQNIAVVEVVLDTPAPGPFLNH